MSQLPAFADCGRMASMLLLLALTLLGSQAQTPPAPADVPPIRSFMRVTTEFCTGGQPRLEHFAQLKAEGVRAVLNLRTPGEHRAAEEQDAVQKAGLKYFNIPVDTSILFRNRSTSSCRSRTIRRIGRCSSTARPRSASARSG